MQEVVLCLGEHTFREGIVDAPSVGVIGRRDHRVPPIFNHS